MNRLEIFQLMGVPPRGLLISEMKILSWGLEICLRCLYDPEENKAFQIVFTDCQKVTWDLVDAQDAQDEIADVIAIFVGKSKHREPANIRTTAFELQVWYGEMNIQKDWG